MTFRDLNTRVFRREPVGRVLWQPRMEHWYGVNKNQGTLPERYRDMSMLEVFDDLGCSVRPYWAFNPCIRIEDDERVTRETRTDGDCDITTTHTPVGDLVAVHQRAEQSHHPKKYDVVTPDDMKVQKWILRHKRVWFDEEKYAQACAHIGDRAAPSIYIPRINIMRIVIDFMGFENGLTGLYECPAEMESLIRTINESDDAVLDTVCDCPIEIVNFGDNVHQALCPPPIFEQWVQPEYIRRNERLHAAGKQTYPHWDGDCGQLLPYAQDCGFDGYEAITPLPQGDVTLEQVRDALGDGQIMIDGIPCTDFLTSEPVESLIANTRKCIEYFHPHLVLGISDEISPVGDIERVRMVTEICAEYTDRTDPTDQTDQSDPPQNQRSEQS
jgi:hypothetical protein